MESIDVVLTELAEGEGEGGTRTWDKGKARRFRHRRGCWWCDKRAVYSNGDRLGCYYVKLVDGFENWSGKTKYCLCLRRLLGHHSIFLGSQSKEYIGGNLNINTLNVHVAEGPINRRHHITHWLLRCKDAEIEVGIQCHVRTGWV